MDELVVRKTIKFKRRRKRGKGREFVASSSLVFDEEIEAEYLPMNNIKSIVKFVLPKLVFGKKLKVNQSFYVLLSKLIGEFIHIICSKIYLSLNNKSTINDEDLLSVIESLGISQYSVLLRVFMSDYREMGYNVMMKRLGLEQAKGGLLAIGES